MFPSVRVIDKVGNGVPKVAVVWAAVEPLSNFLLVCLLFAMLLLTGIDTIIEGTHHNLVFAGHKLATIAACGLVGAHVYMALVNRGTRNAMRGGLDSR